ncbi:MAG: hypothetical protein IPM26_13845 [Saprospiraceae bacterium]|nr:hypothetical protein [Saprospiraceae bacterium]
MTTENQYSLQDFVRQLIKWRKFIIYSVIGVFLISVIATLLMPDYYKAESIFYAASQDMADPVPLGLYEKPVRIYGDEKDLDRLFSISLSNEVVYFLIDSFDFYKIYRIDRDEDKARYKVKTKFLDHYKTLKTKYGALSLSFEDKDPETAAAVVNATRDKINETAQSIIKHSQALMISKYETNIAAKESLLDSISSKVLEYKNKNKIHDSRSQGEVFTHILATSLSDLEESKAKADYYRNAKPFKQDSLMKYEAKVRGYQNKVNQVKEELKLFEQGISVIRKLETEEFRQYDQLSADKERLKQLYASYNAPFTAIHVVEYAEVPMKPSRPKRTILVLIAVCSAFVFSSLGVFLMESFKS